MHKITVEISDEVFALLKAKAERAGTDPARLAAEQLAKENPVIERDATKTGDIRKFFGCVSVGHPSGADNEKIDEDLAREYGLGYDAYHHDD